jgi:hypothetical protein
MSSSDWLEQSESLTCGSRSTVSVDRSTININRAAIGLGWAWAGPGLGRVWAGLGRVGPTMCQALVLPRHLFGFKTRLELVGLAHGGLAGMVHGPLG